MGKPWTGMEIRSSESLVSRRVDANTSGQLSEETKLRGTSRVDISVLLGRTSGRPLV